MSLATRKISRKRRGRPGFGPPLPELTFPHATPSPHLALNRCILLSLPVGRTPPDTLPTPRSKNRRRPRARHGLTSRTSALPYSGRLSRLGREPCGSFVGQYTTPFSSGETTNHPRCPSVMTAFPRKKGIIVPRRFTRNERLAHNRRLNRDSSRSIVTWPLHHGPLPDHPGCIPRKAGSSNDFCTGTDPHR